MGKSGDLRSLFDRRYHAAKYLRGLAEKYPKHAQKLNAAAQEFEQITAILWKEMIPVLGGWERGEMQTRRLARLQTRRLFAGLIDRMQAHDERALLYLEELAADFAG